MAIEEFPAGHAYKSREPVWILFRQRPTLELDEMASERMLFRYSDMTFRNFQPLARWFRRADVMEPVYHLYLAALPTRALYLEHRFLAFAQAIEAFYFRKHRKQATLKDIVQALIDDLPANLRKHVPAHFADLTRDTRHWLTHWNPKYEPRAAKGADLFAATRGAKLLFELTFLQQLGFSKRQIQTLVESNQRLISDIQMSFASL